MDDDEWWMMNDGWCTVFLFTMWERRLELPWMPAFWGRSARSARSTHESTPLFLQQRESVFGCKNTYLPERLSREIPTCFFFAFEPTGFQKTSTTTHLYNLFFTFTGSSWRVWPFPKMARKLFGSSFRPRNLRATQLLTSLDIVLFEVPAGTPAKSNID